MCRAWRPPNPPARPPSAVWEVCSNKPVSMFDDDPELLCAALDIIERWKVEADTPKEGATAQGRAAGGNGASSPQETTENGSVDGSDVAIAAQTQTQKRALKASTLASTRVRRREEIIYLRDRVKEMQEQFEQLQRVHPRAVDSTHSGHVISAMWKDIAGRQHRLRQRSELEQAKLKDQLAMQMKVAKGLVKLVQKAKRIEDHGDFYRAKRIKTGKTDISYTNSIGDRLEKVKALYAERHMAFHHEKFINASLKFSDVSVSEEYDDHMVLEVCEAWTVPFGWQRVLNAIWAYHIKRCQSKLCQSDYVANVSLEDDVLFTRFAASERTTKAHGTLFAKLFMDANASYAAVVSNMQMNPPGAQSESLFTQGDFWLRTIPLPAEEHRNEMTLVQSRERFRIFYSTRNSPSCKKEARRLSTFILGYVERDVELRHEVVDALLLSGHR